MVIIFRRQQILCEIEAQKYLISVEKDYNIPIEQTNSTIRNLRYWESLLEKENDENN